MEENRGNKRRKTKLNIFFPIFHLNDKLIFNYHKLIQCKEKR